MKGFFKEQNIMSAIAHINDNGEAQLLADHLRGTASFASEFASAFGASGWGKAAGLLHDDGKYLHAFQERIRTLADGKPAKRVVHSTPGAVYAIKHINNPPGAGKLLAYCTAGHHTGLPDGKAGDDDTCLARRLVRSEIGPGFLATELPSALEPVLLPKQSTQAGRIAFSAAFFTRMIYSCLVDADFLDTEYFCDPERSEKRKKALNLGELKPMLDAHLTHIVSQSSPTELNRLRARILEGCRSEASFRPGLFSLTVPTGGGKTLSSMAFAMDHALRYGLRRIIYVIPYTSIIEQTAQVFREIFGSEAVLEHHSNLVQEQDGEDDEAEERRRLAAENWDAPIVVTTNVQFFESFYANRSSKTRKLHNVAKSVVILDEAQMLPVPVLRPTLEVLRELAERYGTTIVLCTATQPALAVNDEFQSGLEGVREMMSEPIHLERAFKRVYEKRLGIMKDADVARLIRKEERCICIVNTRKHARLLFQALEKAEGGFHLSAAMCPVHRSGVLGDPKEPAAGTIRQRLRDGEPCRVVSTQLVEAGVDVDFPVVIRTMAGIDSIVQAAGRCNREGKLKDGGRLYVFTPEEGLPAGHFRQTAQISELVLHNRKGTILDSETVRAYFKELYWLKDHDGGLDNKGILSLLTAGAVSGDFPFKTVAELYRIIPDTQIPVIVPFDKKAATLCEALRYNTSPGWLLRKLQPYTIQVYPLVLAGLKLAGYVEGLQDECYHVLTDIGRREAYDDRFGLNPDIREFHEVENLML
jgi:CRISPR-associated endonuclease/helicase Cas3